VVDTALAYPHPTGLPYRLALRRLALDVLGRRIQTANSASDKKKKKSSSTDGGDGKATEEDEGQKVVGHDSVEDAVAAGELVRAAIAREWIVLRASGWRVDGDSVVPPAGMSEEDGKKAGKPVGRYLMPAEGWWLPDGGPGVEDRP
jgi:hypothetical protein